jgi:hypothetical protein
MGASRSLKYLAVVLLCLPGIAQAQATRERAPDIVVQGQKPDKDRVVCRSEQVTGSIMPKRVCRTARQAEEERERGLAGLREAQAEVESEAEIRQIRDSQVNESTLRGR